MNIKFRSIIDQTGKFTYNATKIILDYLRPLCKDEYSINETEKFPNMLSLVPSFQDDEEDVSYHVDWDFLSYKMVRVDDSGNLKRGRAYI